MGEKGVFKKGIEEEKWGVRPATWGMVRLWVGRGPIHSRCAGLEVQAEQRTTRKGG